MKLHVTTTINGEETEFLTEPGWTALRVLRDELQLTGTKEGCGTGDCGACTVLVDDNPVCSCLLLAAELDGRPVRTVEGVATGATLHPVQQELIDQAGLQCGICTPGIVVAACALLDKVEQPDESTIRYWLAGNLCRCTGYDKIVRAVQAAAATMHAQPGGDPPTTDEHASGTGQLATNHQATNADDRVDR